MKATKEQKRVARGPLLKLREEDGHIILLFAVCSILLVIFAIGYQIDIPTLQAAAVKGQKGLDMGARGALQLPRYLRADRSGYQNTIAYLGGQGVASGKKYFREVTSREDMDFVVWIPQFNNGNTPRSDSLVLRIDDGQDSLYNSVELYDSRCSLTALECNLSVSDNVKQRLEDLFINNRPNGVFTYGDALVLFARLTPHRYLPKTFLGPSGVDVPDEIELMTIAVVPTAMIYLLIDPTFPTEGNYFSLFGDGNPGQEVEGMWPLGAFITGRDSLPNPRTGQVPWPMNVDEDDMNWLVEFPKAGRFDKVNPLGVPYGQTVTTTTKNEIRRFYAGMCDNLPFFYFKDTIVNLLDRFIRTSAASATTYVGLTGVTPPTDDPRDSVPPIGDGDLSDDRTIHFWDVRLVPVFPIVSPIITASVPPLVKHPIQWGVFDEYRNGSGFLFTNRAPIIEPGEIDGLHRGVIMAFNGYVHNQKVDKVSGFIPQEQPESKRNWFMNLCGCRAYFQTEGGTANLLSRDEEVSGEDHPALSHNLPQDRMRGAGGRNWCADDPVSSPWIIEYNQARSGAGSESARNLVAGLGMRVINSSLPADNAAAASWTRPPEPTDPFVDDGTIPNINLNDDRSRLLPGESFLPYALRSAVDVVYEAANDYKKEQHQVYRPLRKQVVAYFGFRPWSDYSLQIMGISQEKAVGKLNEALEYALCESKTSVILSFLLLDQKSVDTFNLVKGEVEKYEAYYNSMLEGGNLDPPASTNCDPNMAPIYLLATDYTDTDFWNDLSERKAKMRAAANYRGFVPDTVMSIIFSDLDVYH